MTWQNRPVAWGGHREPWGAYSAPGGSNPIDRLVWDVSYEAPDAGSTTWTPATGTGDALITAPFLPTLGQSTAPLTGLPSRLEDQAILLNGGANWNISLFPWTNSSFHLRFLMNLSAAVANGDRLFRYVVTGVRLAEIRLVSRTQWIFTVRNGGSRDFTIATVPTGWVLVDWVVDGTTITVYINGVEHNAPAGPEILFANNEDAMSFLGFNPLDGLFLFAGWRFGQTINLADHQADATLLGL